MTNPTKTSCQVNGQPRDPLNTNSHWVLVISYYKQPVSPHFQPLFSEDPCLHSSTENYIPRALFLTVSDHEYWSFNHISNLPWLFKLSPYLLIMYLFVAKFTIFTFSYNCALTCLWFDHTHGNYTRAETMSSFAYSIPPAPAQHQSCGKDSNKYSQTGWINYQYGSLPANPWPLKTTLQPRN